MDPTKKDRNQDPPSKSRHPKIDLWKPTEFVNLLPKEQEEIGVVQLVGVVIRRPPVVLRRGGASMVKVEEGELIHGFAREREGVWGEWEEERELGEGSQVIEGRADEWGRGWDVAASFCAHDTQRRCTSGPSASESRTVRGWGDVTVKSMSPR